MDEFGAYYLKNSDTTRIMTNQLFNRPSTIQYVDGDTVIKLTNPQLDILGFSSYDAISEKIQGNLFVNMRHIHISVTVFPRNNVFYK